jgi:hypothetical protein
MKLDNTMFIKQLIWSFNYCLHGQSLPESAAAATSSATETMRGKPNLSLHQSVEVKIENS